MTQKKKSIVKIIAFVIILIVFAFLPTHYFIETPGTAEVIEPLVSIDGVENHTDGEYMLTTVHSIRATPLMLALSVLDKYADIYSESDMIGEIDDYETYLNLQKYMMDSSKQSAIEAAYQLADYPVKRHYLGVYVSQVLPSSDFYQQLQAGDIVTAVNGESFANAQAFIDAVSQRNVGDKIEISFIRDGNEETADGKLILLDSTGVPGLGIGVTDYAEIDTDPAISIETGAIGGPSAGFMFALQTYTLLVDQSLPAGKHIAGTGTIDSEGNVGRIGGIDKKVVAADKAGAKLFFAPDDEITSEMKKYDANIQSNYQEALAAAEDIQTDMKIVPVKTLQDAIDYLEALEMKKEADLNLPLFSWKSFLFT